jgi:hypothetical protein
MKSPHTRTWKSSYPVQERQTARVGAASGIAFAADEFLDVLISLVVG